MHVFTVSSLIVWLSGAFAGMVGESHAADGKRLRAEGFANPKEGTGVRLAGAGKRAPAELRARDGSGRLLLEDATGRRTELVP